MVMFVIAIALLLWAVVGFEKRSGSRPWVAEIELALQAFIVTHLIATLAAFWLGVGGADPSVAYDLVLPAALLVALAVIGARRMGARVAERTQSMSPYRTSAEPLEPPKRAALEWLVVRPSYGVAQGIVGLCGTLAAIVLGLATPGFCSWFPGTCSSRRLADSIARYKEEGRFWRRSASFGGTFCHSQPVWNWEPPREYKELESRGESVSLPAMPNAPAHLPGG